MAMCGTGTKFNAFPLRTGSVVNPTTGRHTKRFGTSSSKLNQREFKTSVIPVAADSQKL